MKKLFILFIFLTSIIFAQNNDSIRIENLKSEINNLKNNVNESTYLIDKSSNINEIHFLSSDVYNFASNIADSIKIIYKLDCDDDYMYGAYMGMATIYSQTNPSISAVYYSLAASSIYNDDCSSPPNYYDNIKTIRDISERISKSNNLSSINTLSSVSNN